MSATLPPISDRAVILTAIDATAASTEAVLATAKLAALPGSEIHLVHVIEPFDTKSRDASIDRGRALLEHVSAGTTFGDRATYHLAAGKAWREIVQLAADLQADLVVVGSHNRAGLERVMLGSVSEQIVRNARCPVYVARPKQHSDGMPEIEPPCPACLSIQASSKGAQLWCEHHGRRHVRGRLHYQIPPAFTTGSSLIRV